MGEVTPGPPDRLTPGLRRAVAPRTPRSSPSVIWYYDTRHTSEACGAICFAELDAPYNLPNGDLNACLQCDEDESGAVFAAVAGRTRRNTGIPPSICRPCSEVRPLTHEYGAPAR